MKTLSTVVVLLSALLLAEAAPAQTLFPPGYGSGFYGGPQFGQPLPGTAAFPFSNPFVRSAYAAELYYQDAMLAREEAAMHMRMDDLDRMEAEEERAHPSSCDMTELACRIAWRILEREWPSAKKGR